MFLFKKSNYKSGLTTAFVFGLILPIFKEFHYWDYYSQQCQYIVPYDVIYGYSNNNNNDDEEEEDDNLKDDEDNDDTSKYHNINISNNISKNNNQPRLLCWLMSDPNILDNIIPAWKTWTEKCDVRLLFSTETNASFSAIGVPAPSGKKHISLKSKLSWKHVYDNYFDRADYFLKADPDSYIFVENLKHYLSSRNPENAEIMGHALQYLMPGPYGNNFSGFYPAGQAIVLSRSALKVLGENGLSGNNCYNDGQGEDLKTSVCLEKFGVPLLDTRDRFKRETFFCPLGIGHVLGGTQPKWYTHWYRRSLGYCKRTECNSHFPIVSHYNLLQIHLIDYLTKDTTNRRTMRMDFVDKSILKGNLNFRGGVVKPEAWFRGDPKDMTMEELMRYFN